MLRVFTPKDLGLGVAVRSLLQPPKREKRPQGPASSDGSGGDGIRRLGIDGDGDNDSEDNRNTVITIRDNDIMQVTMTNTAVTITITYPLPPPPLMYTYYQIITLSQLLLSPHSLNSSTRLPVDSGALEFH